MKKIFFSSYVLLGLIGLVLISCANEKNFQEAMLVEKKTVVPTTAKATVLNISSTPTNGGMVGTLTSTGNGAMESTTMDADGETVQPFTIISNGKAEAKLSLDTTWVEKFGVEIISYPKDINTKDLTNAEQIGSETTMATWDFSDGQSVSGFTSWSYPMAENTVALPHLEVNNLRFNKVVSVEVLSERFAKVTLSFLVNVDGKNSKTTIGAGEKEILVSYIQAIPEPELSLDLKFSTQGTNLIAELTVTSSKGEKWSNPWYASQIGRYNDLKTLYVSTTEVVDKVQNLEEDPTKEKEVAFEENGANWEMSTSCQKVTDSRFWLSDANGKVGPQMVVFFYTTSVVFTAPNGEKITVNINQETTFVEDGFSTNDALVGDVKTLPNETTEYVYAKSYTYSANHYVSCTVVDGEESKSFKIDCLENGLFRQNVCTTNLYHTK